MEKFTRVLAKEDIKTFDDAGIAQLGNLNKVVDEIETVSQSLFQGSSILGNPVQYKKIIIPSSEIATLFSNPIQLVAAPSNPGSQYFIIERIIVEITAGLPGVITANLTRIYDSFGSRMNISSTFFTNNQPSYVIQTSTPMQSINDGGTDILIHPPYEVQPFPALRNLNIRMNTGNPTGITTQVMTVKIWYRVENIG